MTHRDFTGRALRALLVAAALGVPGLMAGAAQAAAPSQAEASSSGGAATPNREPEQRWVTHRVVPGETVPEIAARYGVSKEAVLRWNKKRLGDKGWIYAGQKLRVYARKTPPPRQKIRYEVQFGDSWQKIANRHNVQVRDLRRWNKNVPRAFKAGTDLVIWTNPKERPAAAPALGADGEPVPDEEADLLVDVTVPPGGWSVGKPNRGRLVNGVRLPDSELYTIRKGVNAYGSSHAIEVIVDSIASFRQSSGYSGDLYIGAISKRGGGRYRPHNSHQSGRDVDIKLPKKPGVSSKSNSPTDIDWKASWELVKAFANSGEVEYIFLSRDRQRRLYDAAKRAGASAKELKLIQYPRSTKAKRTTAVVRHAKGHTTHIHVRVKCAENNARCKSY
jgi:LysM repeat protein